MSYCVINNIDYMISVCMATYNGEKYIREQLMSILSQLDEKDEVIISDDGSTDNTLNIIRSIGDDRLHLLHHKSCGETSFVKAKNNFENALSKAKGEYIFLADQDDIWKENKVMTFLRYLADYHCVQSDCTLMCETPYTSGKLKFRKSLLGNIIHLPFRGCNMAFTKDFLDVVLPFPPKIVTHDSWIGCCAVAKSSYKKIDEELLNYRIHPDNVSVGKSRNTLLYKIKYRIDLLLAVIKRCL